MAWRFEFILSAGPCDAHLGLWEVFPGKRVIP